MPEMIEIAGGIDVFAKPGDPSARLTWEQVREAEPDVVVAMPCGYDEAGAAAQLALLGDRPELRGRRVVPVDANGCFSRPGPRIVDGIERLAGILHGISLTTRPAGVLSDSAGLV